jgi:hypothetical protein
VGLRDSEEATAAGVHVGVEAVEHRCGVVDGAGGDCVFDAAGQSCRGLGISSRLESTSGRERRRIIWTDEAGPHARQRARLVKSTERDVSKTWTNFGLFGYMAPVSIARKINQGLELVCSSQVTLVVFSCLC